MEAGGCLTRLLIRKHDLGHMIHLSDAVIRLRQTMSPQPTDVQPVLKHLAGIKAVIFDVYGTLIISGSGDVGTVDEHDPGSFIPDAVTAAGINLAPDTMPTIEELHDQIREFNEQQQSLNSPKPEVDIVEVWRRTLSACGSEMDATAIPQVVQLAAEYEARANPTWPMPGADDLIAALKSAKFDLGIVSNAQVFTPPLVEDLIGSDLESGGFDLDLCVFSNRFRQAKPAPRLFDVTRKALSRKGIGPHEAVYVGNDMLNDVWTASQAGLRTAWFAGDRRSCRRREDDPRCRSLVPDIVLTDLRQLLGCISS